LSEKTEHIFCAHCGTQNEKMSKFCIHSGQLLDGNTSKQSPKKEPFKEKPNKIIDTATSRLNSWTGGQGSVQVNFKTFFQQVFKTHTKAEAEEIFIVGTKKTTPSLEEVVNDKVQPWLFSRILVFILSAGLLLFVFAKLNQTLGDQIAMDVVIAIAVPVAALVLFFEINVYKNISFYQVTKIIVIGGVLALILTIVLDHVLSNVGNMNFINALMTGIIEESAKVAVAAYFIRKLNIKRIFNGMLLGAAVGTGFAAFENIQYMVVDDQLVSFNTALIRTLLSISDHTEWCAIAAAALVIVKSNKELSINTFLDTRFLRFFGLVVVIHMCWDWSLLNEISYLRYGVLAVITWITVFVLIHAGLREVRELQIKVANDNQT
jgi:RsiW-degrading membrane proteinase PrsW (M82 family)